MRRVRIFFLLKIFDYGVAQRAFGARRKHAQVLGERFHMAVILSRIKL